MAKQSASVGGEESLRVLQIWDAEYPWDVRAEKVSRALTDAGHHVAMVARNRRRDSLVEELPECTVHRMRPWRFLGRRLDAALQFPAFFNPRWANLIVGTGRRVEADVILVRDIPLGPTAVWAGRRLGVPVILDMAEHYAALMQDLYITRTAKFGDRLVRNPSVVAKVEEWVLARVDHTFTVVEESADRLIRAGVPSDRVSVVGNTPALTRLEQYEPFRERRETRADGPLRLGYLGLMEEARGVRQVIDAVARLRADGTPATLDLIGEGFSRQDFEARTRELGLDDGVVRFHGYVEYRQALEVVSQWDAGMIPHFASESWENTIPNKLFDYMSLGVPVVASDVTPVARVLSETGAGVTFRDRDTEDLVQVLRAFAADPDRETFGAAGVDAIRDRFHFERDAQVLVRQVEALGKVGRRAAAAV